MVSSLYCIWLIVSHKMTLGVMSGKARSGVRSLKPGDLLYFPGFGRSGEGVVCTAYNKESCPQSAGGSTWYTIRYANKMKSRAGVSFSIRKNGKTLFFGASNGRGFLLSINVAIQKEVTDECKNRKARLAAHRCLKRAITTTGII